jgi:hypothetical protein
MNRSLVRLIRVLLLLTFFGCAFYGPRIIMSDTHPIWRYPWLQTLVAAGVCICSLGMALCFSLCCLSGDISRSEERHNQD